MNIMFDATQSGIESEGWEMLRKDVPFSLTVIITLKLQILAGNGFGESKKNGYTAAI